MDEAYLLPRRVRQASLAPQLRNSLVPGPVTRSSDFAAAAEAFDSHSARDRVLDDRSPEQTRSTVAAIQQGWERGRSVFDAPDKDTGLTGPRATGEDSSAGPEDDPDTASTPPADALVTPARVSQAPAAGTQQSND